MPKLMGAGRKALCFVASLSLVATLFIYGLTPSKRPPLYTGLRLIDRSPPDWQKATYSPAMQEAVNEYLRGMSVLESAEPVDIALARRLFADAANHGLPHASYGLACAIYRARDVRRYDDALSFMQDAAKHNVMEAKVGAASYYLNGIGTWADPQHAFELYIAALRFRFSPPVGAADPVYLYRSNPAIVVFAFIYGESSGICSPPISAQKMLEAMKTALIPRKIES